MTLEQLKARYPGATTFTFGDSESLCDELLQLVRSGKKTAACDRSSAFGPHGDPLPVVGRRDIALNWSGSAALVIETVEVIQRRFCDVDEQFALAEGENTDLAGWRRAHQQYFARNGGFDDEMLLICERFKLIEDLKA